MVTVGIIFNDQIATFIMEVMSGISNSLSINQSVRDEVVEEVESSLNREPPENNTKTKNKQNRDYYVYFGYRDGTPVYVGITNNIVRRGREHGKRFNFIAAINDVPLKKFRLEVLNKFKLNGTKSQMEFLKTRLIV